MPATLGRFLPRGSRAVAAGATVRLSHHRLFGSMPSRKQAAVKVFCSRQAMVIGPTPPGTGVITPAVSPAEAKCTAPTSQNGQASCRERVLQYMEIPVGAGSIKKKTQ